MATEYQQEAEEKRHHGFHRGNYVMKKTETDASIMYTYVRSIPKIEHATKGAFPEKECEIERIVNEEIVVERVPTKNICHLDEWYSAHEKQATISTYWDSRVAKPIVTANPKPTLDLGTTQKPAPEQTFVQLSLF